MMYYRIAARLRLGATWRWRTTKLHSLKAVSAHLEHYRWPDRTELRVFFASSPAYLDEMLQRANEGKASTSVPAETVKGGKSLLGWDLTEGEEAQETAQSIPYAFNTMRENGRSITGAMHLQPLDLQRLEMELGAGGDHDMPYCFTWPVCWPQALAWIRMGMTVHPDT
jgi:hypothetical protein